MKKFLIKILDYIKYLKIAERFIKAVVVEKTNIDDASVLSKASSYVKLKEGKVFNHKTKMHVPYYDSKNLKTVGYGTLIESKGLWLRYSKGMTEVEAEKELRQCLKRDLEVLKLLHSDVVLNENQFVALLGLCYNMGFNNYKQTQLCRLINNKPSKHYSSVEEAWTTGWVDKDLIPRRKEEFGIFNGGEIPKGKVANMYQTFKRNKMLV